MILRSKKKGYPVDKLTKLYTRDFLFDFVDNKIQLHQKFGLILLDIDFFKTINDTYGHLKGDEVIYNVAKFLKNHIGDRGVVIRYGGDEFVIIIDTETEQETNSIMNKIEKNIINQKFSKNPPLSIHLSMGGAVYPDNGIDLLSLIKNADKKLYQRKRKRFIRGRRILGREKLLADLRDYLENTISGQGDILVIYGEEGAGKTTVINELMKYASLMGFDIRYHSFKDEEEYSIIAPLTDVLVYKNDIPTITLFKNLTLQLLKSRPLFFVYDGLKDEFYLPHYQELKTFAKNKHILIAFIVQKSKLSLVDGVKIEKFTEEELKNIISGKFLGHPVQDSLVQEIYRLSGGNPGNTLRIVQNAIDNGTLFLEDGVVRSKGTISTPESLLKKKINIIAARGNSALNAFECAALLYPVSDPKKISEICGIKIGILKEIMNEGFENGEISSGNKFLFTDGFLRTKLQIDALKHRKDILSIAKRCEDNKYYGIAGRLYKSLKNYQEAFRNYINAAKSYMDKGNIDKAFASIRECRKISDKVKVDRRYYEYYGDIYYKKGQYSRAIEYYQSAVDKFGADELKRKIAHCYVRKGDTEKAYELFIADKDKFLIDISELFILVGLPKKALKFAQEAVEHYNEPDMVMRAYAALGASYYSLKNYSKAYFYFSKGVSIAKQINDDYFEGIFDNRMGILKMDTGEEDAALKYLLEAENIFRRIGDESSIASILLNIGIIYNEKHIFDDAEKCFISSINAALSSENTIVLAKALDNIAELYLKIGKITEGIEYAEKGLKITRKMRLKQTYIRTGITLSRFYLLENRMKDAEEILRRLLTTAKRYNLKEMQDEIYLNLIRCTMKDSPLSTKRIIDKLLRDGYNNKGDLFRVAALYWNGIKDKEKAESFIQKAIREHKYGGKLIELAEDYFVYGMITNRDKADEYRHLSKEILRRYNIERGFEEAFYRHNNPGH